MKKMLTMLLTAALLCALAATAFAIALPAGTTYEDYLAGNVQFGDPEPIEVTECLGMEEEAFDTLVKEKGVGFGQNRTRTGVRRYEDGTWTNCITEFMLYTDGFTVFGFEVDSRLPEGYRTQLEEDGFARTMYQFEGGLEFMTYEKTVGEALYRFKINACDGIVTYMEYSVSSIEAHIAAQQQ